MLWPIGQPAGAMRGLADRSLDIWSEMLVASGIWHDRCGSLHLAYREDEEAVLDEFARQARDRGHHCTLLTPKEIAGRFTAVREVGLRSGVWSPTEIQVDPREVLARLSAWLAAEHGVEFHFGCAATSWDGSRLTAGGRDWRAALLVVCSGPDLRTLFPEWHAGLGLVPCKLQMMRTAPMSWRLGTMVAAGLTLRHYCAFADCPSLPALRARVTEEMPEYDRFGIHVMAAQNGLGEVLIGDSHEYGDDIQPFDKPEIDRLILTYLSTFLDVEPATLPIAARWHGVYVKHPTEPFVIGRPAADAVVVTGVGGAGMTLSFGLAERVVREHLS
jgi:FAD dependent oxidoreductase TIGR03364